MASERSDFVAALVRDFPPHVLDAYTPENFDSDENEALREKCREVYSRVQTYNDLLLTNVAFLHNRFVPVFYYMDKFASEDESHKQSTQNLIDLHLRGIFSMNGQGNTCDAHEEQRPYVEAIIPASILLPLQKKLEAMSDDLFYQIEMLERQGPVVAVSTFEFTDTRTNKKTRELDSVLTVTRDRASPEQPWNPTTALRQYTTNASFALDGAPGNIIRLLTSGAEGKFAYVTIIMKQYCSKQLADALLLRLVKDLDAPLRISDPFVKPVSMSGGYTHTWFGMVSV